MGVDHFRFKIVDTKDHQYGDYVYAMYGRPGTLTGKDGIKVHKAGLVFRKTPKHEDFKPDRAYTVRYHKAGRVIEFQHGGDLTFLEESDGKASPNGAAAGDFNTGDDSPDSIASIGGNTIRRRLLQTDSATTRGLLEGI